MTKPHALNWHPSRSHPLDYLYYRTDKKLVTYDNRKVKISQSGTDFVVTINDERNVTGNVWNTCYLLNQLEVGIEK